MASIIRKQQSFVLSENLDNSQYTGTTAKVVYLNMYTHIRLPYHQRFLKENEEEVVLVKRRMAR